MPGPIQTKLERLEEKCDAAYWAMQGLNQWYAEVLDGITQASAAEIAAKTAQFERYVAQYEKWSRAAAMAELDVLSENENENE